MLYRPKVLYATWHCAGDQEEWGSSMDEPSFHTAPLTGRA